MMYSKANLLTLLVFVCLHFQGFSASCFSQSLEVEITGSREALANVLAAYEELSGRMSKYEVKGKWQFKKEFDNTKITSDVSIIHLDGHYQVYESTLVFPDKDQRVGEAYLEQNYAELVDSRKGIITILRNVQPSGLLPWQNLGAPIFLTPDLDCACYAHKALIVEQIDPKIMKGATKILQVLEKENGDVVIIRKYPTWQYEFFASREFGYLITKVEQNGNRDPKFGKQTTEFGWQRIPGIGMVPKSKIDISEFELGLIRTEWDLSEYKIPDNDSSLQKPSLKAANGWKVVDNETKTSVVIGGLDGQRIRAMLDSIDRTSRDVSSPEAK